jgi:hypothetical protein
MDIYDFLWMETDPDDSNWEAYYRRADPEGDWVRSFYDVPEMFDGSENAWSPLSRHERLAEAMYEC